MNEFIDALQLAVRMNKQSPFDIYIYLHEEGNYRLTFTRPACACMHIARGELPVFMSCL